MEKKDAGRALYLEGWTQRDIAKLLRVSERTVGKWVVADKWKEKKVSADLMQDNVFQRIYKMIDYQTKVLERKTELWEQEAGKENTKLIQRGDLDGLQKLFTTIKRDARKWEDYVTVLTEFTAWLQHYDLELTKQINPHADNFLNEKRKSF